MRVDISLQAPLLCEVAAFVSTCHEDGPAVARMFMEMTASWASQFEAELHSLRTQASDSASSRRADVQAKCALAHALVVITHGASSPDICLPASSSTPRMSKQQAESLAFHMVQAARHCRADCSPALQQRLQATMRLCARVMACHVHMLDAMLCEIPDMLSRAAGGVFAELPADSVWRPVGGAIACYVTQFQGSTYSVNLLNGRALRNGRVPGQLPASILAHPTYRRVFGRAMFEVTAEAAGGSVVFRSARSISGKLYSWTLQDQRLVVCETPVDPSTGLADLEDELELLPCAFSIVVPAAEFHIRCVVYQRCITRVQSKRI